MSYTSFVITQLASVNLRSSQIAIAHVRTHYTAFYCYRFPNVLANHSLIILTFIGFCFNLQLAAVMKDCDVVVLGADAVMKDGSIVNKVGSLAIALAAKRYRVPLMVLAEKTKGEGSHRIVEFEASDPEEVS